MPESRLMDQITDTAWNNHNFEAIFRNLDNKFHESYDRIILKYFVKYFELKFVHISSLPSYFNGVYFHNFTYVR